MADTPLDILSVKDANGNWIAIPALKGDKGDKGDLGIYYGSCTTDGPTDIKEVTLMDTEVDWSTGIPRGARITVFFNYANTATAPKLRIHFGPGGAYATSPYAVRISNFGVYGTDRWSMLDGVIDLVFVGYLWYVILGDSLMPVDGVYPANASKGINRYMLCNTAAGTALKEVNLSGSIATQNSAIVVGTRVTVKFANKNTASNPELIIHYGPNLEYYTRYKYITYNGSRLTGNLVGMLYGLVDLIDIGSSWQIVAPSVDYIEDKLDDKVDKISGKGLSTNDYTTEEKTKLAGVEVGAEVNVQSDWNASEGDAFIQNKPQNLVQDASYVHTDNNYTTEEKTKLAGVQASANVADVSYDTTSKKLKKTINGSTSDIVTASQLKTDMAINAGDVAFSESASYASGTVGKKIKDVDSELVDVKSSLNVQAETFFKYNSCNILQFNTPFYRPQIYTSGGITFSWNDDYNECTINGATGGSSSNYNIYVNRTAMPFGMKAGEEYYIITDAPAYIRVIVNMYVSDVATEILRTSRSNTLKIPDEADGLLIQVRVLNNSTVNDVKLHLEILNAETNKKLEGKWNYSNISVFPNIGVIGDSWASGSLHTQSDYVMTNAEISWGQILARSSGINVVNFSQGGLTTKTWLSNTNNGLPKLLNTDKQQLYIINLGINDSNRIADGTYTLGSINDLHIDYTQNPDTFYGNYGKIIGNIMEYATDAKIVCMSVCRPAQRNMDKDIEAIASYYGIPYVNVTKDHFFDSPYFINNIYDGHPTASGYAGMASAIERLIETCLVENTEYFSTYYGLPITT